VSSISKLRARGYEEAGDARERMGKLHSIIYLGVIAAKNQHIVETKKGGNNAS